MKHFSFNTLIVLLLFFISINSCLALNNHILQHQENYRISELMTIVEKNPAIKSAEFFASAQRNIALQEKYWQNPQVNLGFGNNFNSYQVSQTIPFIGKLESKYNIEDSQYKILII